MNVLLHICCGPCLLEPLRVLRNELHTQVKGVFYNPNIHPASEYDLRKSALEIVSNRLGVDVDYEEYDVIDYFSRVQGAEPGKQRCNLCTELRLIKTAEKAAEEGFTHFSTTLLVSPYQRHDDIALMGEKIGRLYGSKFLYYDFRPFFRQGQKRARDMNLYMQKYCGCKYSLEERNKKQEAEK